MPEVSFVGLSEFSDAGRFAPAQWLLRGPPYPYQLVISDTTIRIEGRGRVLRALLPARSCALDDVSSVRLRGALVSVLLRDGGWWTFISMRKYDKIIAELKSRGVPVTTDG